MATKIMLMKITIIAMAFFFASSYAAGNFSQDVTITWGGPRGQILSGGKALLLSLDNVSGSGFESNNQYLYGRFDMQLKLVPNNSAGTVTTFFLSSQGSAHDEIDFEFLGNASGQPYTIHTNIFAQGVGNREQQFRLWFDPTSAFHTYTILWNSFRVIYMVDNIPIRVFNNYVSKGIAFPTSQPMKMYASLWDAEDWATQGGRVKTDWSQAPFKATYQNYNANGCVINGSTNSCNGNNTSGPGQAWKTAALNSQQRNLLRWVQKNHMIYNYCTDFNRFPQGVPKDCKFSQF